jgi:hypothetical protein
VTAPGPSQHEACVFWPDPADMGAAARRAQSGYTGRGRSAVTTAAQGLEANSLAGGMVGPSLAVLSPLGGRPPAWRGLRSPTPAGPGADLAGGTQCRPCRKSPRPQSHDDASGGAAWPFRAKAEEFTCVKHFRRGASMRRRRDRTDAMQAVSGGY